jgi:hypothetical protein
VFIRDLGGFVVYRFRQSQQKVRTLSAFSSLSAALAQS